MTPKSFKASYKKFTFMVHIEGGRGKKPSIWLNISLLKINFVTVWFQEYILFRICCHLMAESFDLMHNWRQYWNFKTFLHPYKVVVKVTKLGKIGQKWLKSVWSIFLHQFTPKILWRSLWFSTLRSLGVFKRCF